ncbi:MULTISPECIES: flagellar protein FliT [Pantoea]|uniref:Flagellar protein FliT n=1 Tax=Pantoea endophytica TaxID=92488 RepID=A0ABX4SN05_9GAMM|nr:MULTISPECIES: flagellar protein FliT [Pantoea]PLR20443.1 flagellar biosynthesis protein FliT [Pantoea endophytica]
MMNTSPMLQMHYQRLLELSQSLLRLARSENWDELLTLHPSYFVAVNEIQRISLENPPSPNALSQLRPLLKQLLDNEEALKQLVIQRQGQLQQLNSNNIQQKTVMNAYSQLSGKVLLPRDVS